MKAWMSRGPGGPETLELLDCPSPSPDVDDVLIEVAACGINFPDSLIIRDLYQFKPERPFAPGAEVAGIVRAVGDAVVTLKPGDRVLARPGWGGLAQEVIVPAAKCAVLPPSMSFEEGAAFLFTYGTSYHALKQRARIRAGDQLLVLGASGGTGVAAIQIAKAFGATVVAATSSEDKAAFARECGADQTVVYPRGPLDREAARKLSESFKAVLGESGADIVYDPVGGDYSEPALRAIAWRGRYLIVGFTAGIPRLPLNLPLLKGCELSGVFIGGLYANEPDVAAQNTRELLELFEKGLVAPQISQVYAFEDAPKAIEAIAERQALGKLVVRIASLSK